MQPSEDSTVQQPAATQLDELVSEAKEVVKNIDDINNAANTQVDSLKSQFNESLDRLNEAYAELDQIEAESSAEFDRLILQQASYLGEE